MRILLLFVLLISAPSFAQLTPSSAHHDFEHLMSYSPRFADFVFTNHDAKKAYILRVECPTEVKYLKSSDMAMPDSSVIVRLQANPKKKGRFSYEIKVYTSDKGEPTLLKLSGIMDEPPYNETAFMQECPTFDQASSGKSSFNLKVTTVDKETGIAIGTSTVVLIENGFASPPYLTNKQGSLEKKGKIGFIYFYAEHPQYEPSELGALVNPSRNEIVILMTRSTVVAVTPPVIITPPLDTLVATVDTIAIPEFFLPETPGEFSVKNFKPINVVFVLDISGSMGYSDKIELLKFSLNKINEILRPCDKISLVTYATNAAIILPPTVGTDKESVNKQVSALKADGSTAGSAGIKLGYKTAVSAFIPDGINHIIVITDGAFNQGKDDYKKVVSKYRKKGYTMSVVGIKNSMLSGKQMTDAAAIGGGAFLSIQNLKDASSLLNEEIMRLTKR